ncbi:WXG100 family type VII secretion target, partial [Amycolatopsis magusensis]|nr:WXG100 family type VII secretion target [Amycolatopsis magusensis]
AAPGMAGSGGAGNAMSGLAGGAAGAAGAAAAKGMMPMMPMMPMGMGAGGDMGSGRRIPPWLVETEDVWGESSVVAPSVIGEEPDAPR